MRFHFIFALLISGFIIINPGQYHLNAQTTGSLTFSVTTTDPAGGYSGSHVIALWIEDTNGNFVKTKICYAQDRIQYLDKWVSNSAYNVVDATTGATLTTHGTLTFSWNGTDISGNIVSDKPYRVWIQMSDRNQSGNIFYVTFTKDTNTLTLNPADTGNFTNMSLQWNPVIGIDEIERSTLSFSCEPNPVSGNAVIRYFLSEAGDVTITLHDLPGRIIAVLCDENQNTGFHTLQFNAGGVIPSPGIYYLMINTGRITETKKIILGH